MRKPFSIIWERQPTASPTRSRRWLSHTTLRGLKHMMGSNSFLSCRALISCEGIAGLVQCPARVREQLGTVRGSGLSGCGAGVHHFLHFRVLSGEHGAEHPPVPSWFGRLFDYLFQTAEYHLTPRRRRLGRRCRRRHRESTSVLQTVLCPESGSGEVVRRCLNAAKKRPVR